MGNCIHITAGTGLTTGFYEIVSVMTGTATLDRSAGTGSAGTYYVGGALATPPQANANATACNTIWIKATGTYTATSAMTVSISSLYYSANPALFHRLHINTGRQRPDHLDHRPSTINLVAFSGGDSGTGANNVKFQNIIFTNTASTKGYAMMALTSGNAFSIYTYQRLLFGVRLGDIRQLQRGFFASRACTSSTRGLRPQAPMELPIPAQRRFRVDDRRQRRRWCDVG